MFTDKYKKVNLAVFYISSIVIGTVIYISLYSIKLIKSDSIPLAGPLSLLAALSIILFLALVILMKKKKSPQMSTFRDVILIVVLFFFLNYNLYGMIPFNCSRSNSILIVGYLAKNSTLPKTKNEIEAFVKEEYFDKYQAIQRRLNEQVNVGNIKELNGRYELTTQGVYVVKIFGFIADLYKIDQNFTKI